MPTYEYACADCGEHLEVVQSFRDDPLTVCPSCQGRLNKVFSPAGIIFKGSGWHIKDYGTSSSPAPSRSESSSSSADSESSSATKSESSSDNSSSEAKAS